MACPVLNSYDAEDGAAPLYFTEKAKLSRFFSGMRTEVLACLGMHACTCRLVPALLPGSPTA